jgi:hypothetical protein
MVNPYIFSQLVFVLGISLHLPPNPAFPASDAQGTLCTRAGQYCVNLDDSGACRVQEATERPQFGDNLAGPFESRAEATKAMCKNYKAATEDTHKCGAVVPDGVCDNAK